MEIKRDIYLDRLIRREKNGLIKIVTGFAGAESHTCCSTCSIIICWIKA